jgi:hypothetical protein
VPQGSTFAPLIAPLDQGFVMGLEIGERKLEESTLYKAALGQPLGGNPSYSMVALLSQQGRLPLLMTQRKLGWALASALELAFEWMKKDAGEYKGRYETKEAVLKANDLPEHVHLDVQLEISLPQDLLQQVGIGMQATAGKLVSRKWARENLMKIAQSEAMEEEIWDEQAGDMMYQIELQKMVAQEQQAMQPQPQAPMPQGMPPEQMPMMPPEQMGMMGEQPPGLPGGGPMQGEIPPEMMMGGMQGPEVEGGY